MIKRKRVLRRRSSGVYQRELTSLRGLYEGVFDAEWYAERYPDVQASELDLLDHFILQGELEGRDPNPYFVTRWATLSQADRVEGGRPFASFLRASVSSGFNPHPCIDIRYLSGVNSDWNTSLGVMRGICGGSYTGDLSDWFSRTEYTRLNDGLSTLAHPEQHFLQQGLREARRPSSTHRVVASDQFVHGPFRGMDPITSFTWDDQEWVVLRVGPSAAVLEQVDRQERHDPRLNAPGALSIAALPVFSATDLEIRDLIDVEGILKLVANGADYVFVVPSIGIGGGEKYMTQLAETLSEAGGSRVLMLVTEDTQEVIDHDLRFLRRHELVRVSVGSLKDLIGRTWKGEFVLALLLLALHPRAVIAANTETGFRAIADYGRSLQQVTSLVAAFFSESPRAIGAPYSARYADLVADHALLLSDNSSVLDQIGTRLLPSRSRGNRFVLPQFVRHHSAHRRDAETRLREARRARHTSMSVLWISRWETFKNVHALMLAADMSPEMRFTAFGPGQESVTSTPTNLELRGPLLDPESTDFAGYDCFLFTSQFEGMPNIVLEMVARGMPVVAPRVGGLSETFSESGLWFYENGRSIRTTAEAIVEVLDALSTSDSEQIAKRCRQAQDELWERHSMRSYMAHVEELLSVLEDEGGHEQCRS